MKKTIVQFFISTILATNVYAVNIMDLNQEQCQSLMEKERFDLSINLANYAEKKERKNKIEHFMKTEGEKYESPLFLNYALVHLGRAYVRDREYYLEKSEASYVKSFQNLTKEELDDFRTKKKEAENDQKTKKASILNEQLFVFEYCSKFVYSNYIKKNMCNKNNLNKEWLNLVSKHTYLSVNKKESFYKKNENNTKEVSKLIQETVLKMELDKNDDLRNFDTKNKDCYFIKDKKTEEKLKSYFENKLDI